jgi:predicted O-linked N-acetylglucosamine transferase (SPINDLY family)
MKRAPITAATTESGPTLVQRAIEALDRGDVMSAASLARSATEVSAKDALGWEVLSIALQRSGDLEASIEAGRKAIELNPKAADFHANLGVVLRAAGRPRDAEVSYRAAIACNPGFAAAHHNLGNLLRDEGRNPEAEQCYLRAVEANKTYTDAWHGLGTALQRQGKLDEASAALERALALRPDKADVICDLAMCKLAQDEGSAALSLMQKAVALDPDLATGWGNLGAVHLRAGKLVDAERTTRRAMELMPQEARWVSNLAVVAKDLGRFDEAEILFRRALALRPGYSLAHANLLFCMNYHPHKTAPEIFAEYRRFDEAHAKSLMPKTVVHANDPSPDRKLRVGYMSPDFREHAARHFLEPLLAHYDRSKVDLYCYAEVAQPDAMTATFKSMATEWRSTVGMSDEAVAAQIRADAIDILVDFGGHTSSSRLLVMARKPAPIQIAHYLGHGYTSGLSAVDVFMSDAEMAPEGSEHLFSERIVRLPRIPVAYVPPKGMPEVSELPALKKGHITFGYFGRPERLNERVVASWSKILKGVPNSLLMLNSKAFAEEAFCTLFADRFAAHGIGRERLRMVYTSPQPKTWSAYGEVDIALDPYPHNAGTTTIEALWLGVPVVSVMDRPSVGRFGISVLGAAGLRDWVAADETSYVALAVAKAKDIKALSELRRGLRDKVKASPLHDGKGLVRDMEAAFRDLWKEWGEANKHNAASSSIERNRNVISSRVQTLDEQGRRPEAAELLTGYLREDPKFVLGYCLLSDIYRRIGRMPQAEAIAREALKIDPKDPSAANALGNVLAARGQLGEAEAAYTIAIEAKPDNGEAYNNRALVEMRRGQLVAAERDLRKALEVRPDLTEIGFNLANAIQDQGRAADAVAEFQATLAKAPGNATGHGMMLFALTYHPGLTGEQIFAEFQRWNDMHAAKFAPKDPGWPNPRTGKRRLRIGYVSPDFANKSSRHFIEPILVGHDRSKVEVFCYAEVPAPDGETVRLRAMAEHWRGTVGLSDDDLAALIRRDAIDVLVDLGGHTARNRLLAFARKPAPVQIAHFLGHGYTSGLTAMDAFLADDALAPPGSERLFSERVVRLPRIPVAYAPPANMPEVAPLPALKNGYVTFGNFGRVVRLNEEVIETWSRILNALPTSRLVLNTVSFTDAEITRRYREMFARHGVNPDRVDFSFTTPQSKTWDAYANIDIALDPFPHNGGTTTIEALWLGVPSICLRMRPSVGCLGATIMGSVGLGSWVASDRDEYVDLAVRRARNIESLATLRANLRSRMAASPLLDARGLAKELERVYAGLWDDYCERESKIEGLQAKAGEAYAAKKYDVAVDLFTQALKLSPRASGYSNLGAALRASGRVQEAEAAYREAIARAPDFANAYGNLGNLLTGRGRSAEAEVVLRRAHELAPNDVSVMRSLGLCIMTQGRLAEAEPIMRKALALQPRDGDLYDNLAQLLRQKGEPVAAMRLYEQAKELITDNWRAIGNMALLVQDLGRFDEAEVLFRRALALRPGYSLAHANLLFCMNYHPHKTAAEIFAEYRRFDEAHAKSLMPKTVVHANDPSPDRKLRVGYMSPDFREHAARHFLEPLLAHYDRSKVALYCYAEVAQPDAMTATFKSMATEWRSTVGMSDEAVAAQIRADAIDILVDFGGHTSSSRLLVMARKPAPIQIAHYLGHGYTSGLSAVDVFMSDAEMAPEGSEHLFSERIVRLPRIPVAYVPPKGMPEVSELPALKKGHITFGYFGRPERLNERVVASWSKILKGVPNSLLMLNSKAFAEEAFCTLFADRFAAHGIGRERLRMVYTSPQPKTWSAYGEVDIALDPYPHNAGTTTIEALWLGVPVVSVMDRPSVGRFGISVLGAAGLRDWVAVDETSYVALAVAKAKDIKALSELRRGLRDKVKASPLFDGKGLVRDMEAAFRDLWKEWGAKKKDTRPSSRAAFGSALAALQSGDHEAAIRFATEALAIDTSDNDALHVRGIAAFRLGRLPAAIDDLLQAIRKEPARADLRWNVTAMLRVAGRLQEAEQQGREAVRLAPDAPEAHNNLASVLKDRGETAGAETHFRRAIELKPDYGDAWCNLSWLLSLAGKSREAEAAAQRAFEINPKDPNAQNNLGTALMHQDRLREAGECFEKALALKPDFSVAHSNLLFCLNYRTDLSADEIFSSYKRWDAMHAAKLRPKAPTYKGTKDPNRRLKVGYVSPDFRYHAVSFFIESLLAAHDPAQVELTLYSEVPNPDAVTARFKSYAAHWRSTVGLSDEEVAAMVRADGIDVLVDLAGHTAGNRLLAFARKPAPVQVAHMVGSGSTTGLSAIDAVLIDEQLLPRNAERNFSEKSARLSRMPLIYSPPAGMPEVGPLPALKNGYVTFGCFSRAARINENVLAAWARILRSVPDSKLLLNSKPFREPEAREAWLKRFKSLGISADRVDLVYTTPQPSTWEAYGDVDIALDPFPHNAGTTTIEALWLGVPVVSLLGRPPVGRFGAAILGSVGMESWVMEDVDSYVARAATAASNLTSLAALRASLREKFRASPIGSDAKGLAREIESVYRRLWLEYCRG